MPPKRNRRAVVHDEPIEQRPGSGQDPASFAQDLAKQPELLAVAAELLRKHNAEVASIHSELEPLAVT